MRSRRSRGGKDDNELYMYFLKRLEGVEESQEDEVKEEQGGDEQGEGDVLILSRKSNLAMDDNELYAYFLKRLSVMSCPNQKCDCLAILQGN